MKAFNYIENYLLEADKPLLLGLDDLHLVYRYDDLDSVEHHKDIVDDFLIWLRALHEEANTRSIWKNFRLILTYRETYLHLPSSSSPFNVGTEFKLAEFSEKQVQELVDKYELTNRLSQQDVKNLIKQVGGNPFLVQRALDELIIQKSSLKEILDKATTESGIYSQELQKQLFYLKKNSNLQEVFKEIIKSESPVKNLDLEKITQLEALGLVKFKDNGFVPFCELYRNYFNKVL